jgi:hypothetical protein
MTRAIPDFLLGFIKKVEGSSRLGKPPIVSAARRLRVGAAATHGPRSGQLNRPALVQPGPVCALGDAVVPSDVQPQLATRTPLDETSVAALHRGVRPHAIGGAVVPVDVLPLDGEVLGIARQDRPAAELLEALPSRKDGNPTPAVVGKVGVSTSRAHTLPDIVEASSAFTVSSGSVAGHLRGDAAAREGLAPPKIWSERQTFFSAITAAAPDSATAWGVALLSKDKKPAESLSGHVFQSRVLGHFLTYHEPAGITVETGA